MAAGVAKPAALNALLVGAKTVNLPVPDKVETNPALAAAATNILKVVSPTYGHNLGNVDIDQVTSRH